MAGALSLSPTIEVFPCPNCGETINTSVSQCTFCSAAIDHSAALASAAETSRISNACSDASYLKVMAWAVLAFFGVLFVPFISLAGLVGLWFLRIAIPVMVIRWWIKFGAIKTPDTDFKMAKRSAIIVGVLAVLDLASVFVR